jgi:pre-60S factor REI1
MSVSITAKSSELFTCVTCNIAFNNADLQRDHYKADWHTYNLKRKVAELPPIDYSDFARRVQMQKAQVESAQNQAPEETFCKLCSKHFTSINTFTNHKQSKKHKDLEAAALSSGKTSISDENEKVSQLADEQFAIKSDRAAKKAVQMEEYLKKQQELEAEMEEMDDEDKEWEDIGEDELNECGNLIELY